MALELPGGDARPVDVPASLRDAQQDVIDADPFLLNFLVEAALRHRDYTETVALRERAVAASGRRDSTYRLTLAASLRRRAQSQPGSSGADLRSALGYAQEAIHERRRWKGPSADALGEVLDILAAAGDMSAAITAALPESERAPPWKPKRPPRAWPGAAHTRRWRPVTARPTTSSCSCCQTARTGRS